CDAGRATPSPLNRPALTRYYRPARSFFKFGAQPTTQETDDSGTLGKFHDPHVSEQPAVDFRVLLAGDSSFRLFRESGDQRGHLGPRKQSFCLRPIRQSRKRLSRGTSTCSGGSHGTAPIGRHLRQPRTTASGLSAAQESRRTTA